MIKPISASDKLKKLAKLLPKPIYIVGGFVRDSLLGYESSDIDICGANTPETVTECLNGTEFIVKTTSLKMMTLKIICDKEQYEYTTFRKESYTKGHSPAEVEVTESLLEDAKRRDFNINAIYYDIISGDIVDPLNGLADLKNRVLNTVIDPREVFSQDGLRLMRLARICGELGFNPSDDTLLAAIKNSALIMDIAPERIRDELDKILLADTTHGIENGHVNAIMLLDKIDVLSKLLPELTLGKGMAQRADFHKYDVYMHIIETVRYALPKVRLPALLHDIAKPACFVRNGKYHGHELMGVALAEKILNRLRYPKSTIDWVSQLVRYHMYDLKCEAKPNTLRLFVQEHIDILEDLYLIKDADSKGSGIAYVSNPSIERLKNTYSQMISEGVPFGIKDLKVKGKDLEILPPKERGRVMNALLKECALEGSNLKTFEKQLLFIKREAENIKARG